jgi:hypothetical protein
MTTVSVLILYITLTRCDPKLPEIALIILLNFIHLICGLFGLIFAILKLIIGSDYLKAGTSQCSIYSFVVNSSNRIEIFTVGFLALMRYLISCHGVELKAKVWFIFYGFVIAPIFGLYLFPLVTGDANPLPSMLFCAPFLKSTPSTFALSLLNPFIFIIRVGYVLFVTLLLVLKLIKN